MFSGKLWSFDWSEKWTSFANSNSRASGDSGGTGLVRIVSNNLAVKTYDPSYLYHNRKALYKRLVLQTFKFNDISRISSYPIAWPISLIFAKKDPIEDNLVGFGMWPILDRRSIGDIATDHQIGIHTIDLGTKLLIIKKLCIGIDCIHDSGFIIGDINMRNVIISERTLNPTIIDCDSFQFRTSHDIFSCDSGLLEYFSPDLVQRWIKNNRNTVGMLRKREDDLHALAVLIFKLLMSGRGPYEYYGQSVVSGDLETAIKQRRYPYRIGSIFKAPSLFDQQNYDMLPETIRYAFRSSLAGNKLLSPQNWISLIDNLFTSQSQITLQWPWGPIIVKK